MNFGDKIINLQNNDIKNGFCKNNKKLIAERRQHVLLLISKGLKGKEIAKKLNVNPSTVSRDINYLSNESQKFLNDLAKSTFPFFYQISIEGITSVLGECWKIIDNKKEYSSEQILINALRLAKECNESIFQLISNGPTVIRVKQLEEEVRKIKGNYLKILDEYNNTNTE